MQIKTTALSGVLTIVPNKIGDSRGYFVETYSARVLADAGVSASFVQDNQSLSRLKGTIRGLHFQRPPAAQAKLVRVVQGAIFDVAVDLRVGSPTYGTWIGETLTAQGGEQLFVPRGFAHGFCTLTEDAIVAYKVDGYYSRENDAGVSYADPDIGIVWPITAGEAVLSEKDAGLPRLRDMPPAFVFGEAF